MPYYKEDLTDLKCPCGMPGCEGSMYFHGKCHPEAPTWASYFDGVLTVECTVCHSVIAEFAIADKPVNYSDIVVDHGKFKESLKFLDITNDVRYLPEEERDNIIAGICDNLGWKREEIPERLQELELLRRLSEN
jgi:hypothetical protein